MTFILILINVVIFILINRNKLYVDDLDSSYLCVFVRKQYYRLISSGFSHEQPMHLLCNMYSLLNIGRVMESYYGPIRFVVIYLVILIIGGTLSLLSRHNASDDYTCSIGASGAICGLIGIYFIKLFLAFGLGSLYDIASSLIPMIIMSFMPGVDYKSHFYGLIVGGIIGFIF